MKQRPRIYRTETLTLAARDEISRPLVSGHSIHSIASLLKRAPSTEGGQ